MHHNHFSVSLSNRVKEYENILWQDFKGVDEEAVLDELPTSLRDDIREFTMKALIENWEMFPKNSPGTLHTLIRKLKMVSYPKFEYIILKGEIADSMYFIVKGIVEVRSEEDEVIATLKHG
jgi:CRP-like cAMP-binding protein